MKHISLFSGIGGFELAAEWAGFQNIASCEINDFGNKVLEYYWPKAYHHRDIHTLNIEILNNELTKRYGQDWNSDDVILSGGFPCQPYSTAGKRLGKEDERHLWPEMLRVISEIQPRWVVGENVSGLISWSGGLVFEEVQLDLEAKGYEVQAFILPAASVNAPHRRDRVWFVAYSNNKRKGNGFAEIRGKNEKVPQRNDDTKSCNSGVFNATDSESSRLQTRLKGQGEIESRGANIAMGARQWDRFPTQSALCSRNDGLSGRLDSITFPRWRNESIKAAGNAIVPQVAFEIFEAIKDWERLYSTP